MTKEELQPLKTRVMKAKGYYVDKSSPDDIKYEVAHEQGIDLKRDGGNESLPSKQAGKIGGPIGGSMVREMVKTAQQNMKKE